MTRFCNRHSLRFAPLVASAVAFFSLVIIATAGARGEEARDGELPITVAAEVKPNPVDRDAPIPLTITIKNGLSKPISFPTYSLEPNDWHGETLSINVIDIYRDGKPGTLYLERPKVTAPFSISGPSSKQIAAGATLSVATDARKWKIAGGWTPGKYRIVVQATVQQGKFHQGRWKLTLDSEAVEFTVK